MKGKNSKPWSGRFEQSTDPVVESFTSSLGFDERLFPYDIQGSIAHARMLGSSGLITNEEAEAIINGLEEIREEWEMGRFPLDESLEDIHMNIEARLIKKIGPAGGKLHTARSRNDQVTLDLRLCIRYEIYEIIRKLRSAQGKLLASARNHIHTLMPGYTHLQRAQPVTFAHHLMAYFEMFSRDIQRLEDCLRRVQVMPLGSGALSGTCLPVDREAVAEELGFDSISSNSLDAVSDRDYALEFLAGLSILMMHLSRLAEEIILWTTAEFGFCELPDSLCTGSSLMPQKKNPDPLELVRGKTGRVYGCLIGLLVTMKALPLSYNRDMQEDKGPLFDAIDTVKGSLSVITLCIENLKVKEDRMLQGVMHGFLEATDLAEYLVQKGVPFRDAHNIIGRLVLDATKRGWTNLSSFSLDELKGFCSHFGNDVMPYLRPEKAAYRKNIQGGTSPSRIEEAIKKAEKDLRKY
ncbi:argininosuccinate lyase [bacterium]|nr:argininosuccinate lyase [bacterium]